MEIYLNEKKNKKNGLDTRITCKALFLALAHFGFPIGEKGQKLKIPKQILNKKWDIKKYVIRGLFDTDGYLFAKKHEGYRYPYISITTYSNILLNQVYELLKEQKYPVYKIRNEVNIRGIQNTQRWMNDIGTSNEKHLIKYKYWLKNKILPKMGQSYNPA